MFRVDWELCCLVAFGCSLWVFLLTFDCAAPIALTLLAAGCELCALLLPELFCWLNSCFGFASFERSTALEAPQGFVGRLLALRSGSVIL
jgi:hypothetical protein